MEGFKILLLWSTLFSISIISTAVVDTINTTQPIKDGETIVSAGGNFELGFFSPDSSKNRHVGIWYKKISVVTVAWVANRDTPLVDSSGVLKVTNQGILTILYSNGSIVWTSNPTGGSAANPVAQLLDSGNLVLRERNDNNPEKYMWQSFDHPCDTLLAGMKLGKNMVTGKERYLSSWNGSNDPSTGDFTFHLDVRGFPQLVTEKGSVKKYSSGPWNGLTFSGTPYLKPNPMYKFYFFINQEEAYYTYELATAEVITGLMISPNGDAGRFVWIDRTHGWQLYLNVETDTCDTYASCGAHGSCNIDNSPQCGCLKGFVPKYQEEWDVIDFSHGCVRRTPLDCQKGDGFLMYSGIRLPDTRNSWFDRSMSLEECRMACLKNCSCMAYATLNISLEGSGCLHWFGDLTNIREYTENGQDIYVRMASSELGMNFSDSADRTCVT